MTTVISDDLILGLAETEQPLSHARIGYQNLMLTGTVSSDVSGGVQALKNPLTYDFFSPALVPFRVTLNIGSVKPVNYVGIAAHTIGTNGNLIIVETSLNNIDFVEQVQFLPNNNNQIMMLFEEVEAQYIRVRFVGGTPPKISVMYIGKALEMQRKIYGGHTPITLSRETVVRPVKSERGQWLGRSIIRSGVSTSYSWKHLTADWYRENFDPFVENCRKYPFFISWKPLTFPDEVGYVWTSDDIAPTNMGIRDYMEVTMAVEGIGNEQ